MISVNNQVRNRAKFQAWRLIDDQVRLQVRNQVINQAEQVNDQVWDQVREQL